MRLCECKEVLAIVVRRLVCCESSARGGRPVQNIKEMWNLDALQIWSKNPLHFLSIFQHTVQNTFDTAHSTVDTLDTAHSAIILLTHSAHKRKNSDIRRHPLSESSTKQSLDLTHSQASLVRFSPDNPVAD